MRLSFVESPEFTEAVYNYFADDAEFARFQEALLADPERSDIMPGCGGIRKTRWRDRRRGKGGRGGLRIIYLFVPAARRILLLDVYDKDEQDDLSQAEKRQLASLARAYKEEAARGDTRSGETE